MDTITFKGKKLPLRVSYYALKRYQKDTGEDISKIDDNIENLEVLLYHALVAGHKAEGKDIEAVFKELHIDREDMELILDESLNEFNSVLTGSFPDPSNQQSGKAGASKKK